MRRYPPFDMQSVPNAPWVNGDVDLGIEGSIIDVRPIDAMQSEILSAVIAAGLVPAENVNNQLAQAIPILASLGGSDAIISTEITKTVGTNASDFLTLNDAFTWSLRKRIIQPGKIRFVHAPGKFNYSGDINFYHPDGDRIELIGAPLISTLSPPSALTYSGNTQSARSQDLATNLAALRVAYGTEISFQTANRFRVLGNIGRIQDFLFSAVGIGFQQDTLVLEYGNQTLTRVSVAGAQSSGILTNKSTTKVEGYCHFIGCYIGVFVVSNGTMALQAGALVGTQGCAYAGLVVSGNAGFGVSDVSGSGPALYSRGNGMNGVEVNGAQIILSAASQSLNNGQAGFFASNPSYIRASGCRADGNPYGFWALFNSFIDASNSSGASSSFAFRADNAAQIYRLGTTATGTVSPAVGSPGNNLSNII